MNQISELLEKAKTMFWSSKSFVPLIDQALELLKQQPTAGDFTKDCRALVDMPADKSLEKYGDLAAYANGLETILEGACDRLDTAEARLKVTQKALEQSKEIFSKKMRSIREEQNKAKDNLHFIESRYWNGIYYQIFELRQEIERMLDKKDLNEFCILMAFMPEEKREAAIAKAKK